MNKNTYFIATFILLVGASFPSFADDLLSVYNLAIKNDPQFRAAQAEYQAQLELKSQSRALLLPTLSLSGQITDQNNEINTATTTTPYKYKTTGYSLNLFQPLYRHANFIGLDKADAQIAQATVVFENAKQDIILRVATQYFAVLAAADTLAFAKAELKSIHEQLLQTQQRFKVGLIAITDVHEARARNDQAVASSIVAENAYAISLETLREITATKHLNLMPISTNHPLVKPSPADITQWVNTAMSQNVLLIASKKNVEVARAETDFQRAGHYPTLDLTAQRSFTDYNGANAFGGSREQNDTSVMVQLNVPLYQGGLVNSRTRAAAFRLTQAREQLELQKRATVRLTRSAYLGVIANISQVNALKQALASSSIALKATQAGYEVGTRTAVDVLDSQRELFRARRDYAQVRYNYVLDTLRLKFAAGTLTALDLALLNPWLK
jgi:outer membrane protein